MNSIEKQADFSVLTECFSSYSAYPIHIWEQQYSIVTLHFN
ncbi:hypothetical protein AM1_A0109 (plasmid) [Acaryochloris marina MBIC11017]|uniref:Uncharacterized protein n=1 Tax=Acaryochloris marina (strain MBIC 11017) TaxID=329726 RepID=A8ZKB8_ACAM1|nr:hypothetical protein AM1_A0109 [Acaryochloris marina MBIC11017]